MTSKITSIDFYILQSGEEKRPHWVSLFKVPSANELLVRVKTGDGVEGFGLATSYTDISPITNVVKSGIADVIIGMDALAPEQIYQKLFGLTSTRTATENHWGRRSGVLGYCWQDCWFAFVPTVWWIPQSSAMLCHLCLLPRR